MRTLAVALTLATLACAFRIPFPANPVVQGRHSQRNVQSACETYTYACVNPGGNCTVTSNTVYPLCLEGTCGSDELCPNVATYQQSCTTTQCIDALVCHPVTRICVKQDEIKPPGASCSADNQCLYSYTNPTSSCSSGVCYGLAVGASCTGPRQCSGRNYCNSNGVCAALLGVGASCSTSDETVAVGVCNSGNVITFGSVGVGGTCTTDGACGDHLFCGDGVCTTPSAPGKICAETSECANGEFCACDGSHTNSTCIGGGSGIPSGGVATVLNFLRCADANSCIESDQSCIVKNCASQYCAYRNLAASQFNGETDCYSKYVASQFNNVFPEISCPSSAAQHFVSFALAVFVTVIALL